jgi:hypothetical protein
MQTGRMETGPPDITSAPDIENIKTSVHIIKEVIRGLI